MYRQLGQDITALPLSLTPTTGLVPSAPLDALPITALPSYSPPMLTVGNPALDIVPYDQIPAFLPSTYSAPAAPAVAKTSAPVASSGSYVSTAPAPVSAPVGQQFSAWLNTGSNKIYLALAGAVVVVAAVAGKKRRR